MIKIKKMKIKLTEIQYKRLLVENDKKFLDGKVEFPNIGNKVNKFIVKLFNYIYKKMGRFTRSNSMEIHNIITRDFGLTKGEAELLGHNYATFSASDEVSDFSSYLGEPLEFYGEFKFNTRIPVSASVSGEMDGYVIGHATSVNEFIKQLKEGDWEDIESEWNSEIESYPEDSEWDIDSDYAADRIGDVVTDEERHGDIQDIIDRIEII